jgi:hypothetical protein
MQESRVLMNQTELDLFTSSFSDWMLACAERRTIVESGALAAYQVCHETDQQVKLSANTT